MANLLLSIKKRWYEFTTISFGLSHDWDREYWYERDGFITIPCTKCPKFNPVNKKCIIPFGSPLRKCSTASIEANLRHLYKCKVLEVGCGASSYAKKLVTHNHCEWTGVDPGTRRGTRKSIKTFFGHAAELPFDNNSFDCIIGIQSFEHFEEPKPEIAKPTTYKAVLNEAWRVLKPNGLLYYDTPVHLHGHPMLIRGEIDAIVRLFSTAQWQVSFQRWRFDHAPLAKYSPPDFDIQQWAAKGISADETSAIVAQKSVWLLTILAEKKA